MNLRLDGRTALITGSSAGIGLAIATGLAREGAVVWLNGRHADRLEEARARLLAEVPDAEVALVTADVGSAGGAEQVLAEVPDVDVLVNNAATFGPQPFAEIPDDEWTRFFETNVMSGVRLSRHHLGRMLTRGEGRIVFIGSDAAAQASTDQLHYSVTKTALLALSRGLAEMTRGTAVTVNTVLPGPTATEGTGIVMDGIAEQTGMTREEIVGGLFADVVPSSLLRRLAQPEEIANLVVFLASPLSAVTNGAAVRAEGGILRSIL